jgi:hypothetical protein
MPIRKFRSLAEAGRVQKLNPGTEQFSLSLRNVFRLAAQFAPSPKPSPGVTKFRNIEEAQAQRSAWMRAARKRESRQPETHKNSG